MKDEAREFVSLMSSLVKNPATKNAIGSATVEKKKFLALQYISTLPVYGSPYKREMILMLSRCYMRSEISSNKPFGKACREAAIASQKGSSKELNESFSKAFEMLLSSTKRNIFHKVEQIIRRINSNHVAIDYYRLYNDLVRFEHDRDTVKLGWASQYWVGDKGEN